MEKEYADPRDSTPFGPAGFALQNACERAGFNDDSMVYSIEAYVKRIQLDYFDIESYVEERDWHDLVLVIFLDLEDLPLAIPISRRRELSGMIACLKSIRDLYLDVQDLETLSACDEDEQGME